MDAAVRSYWVGSVLRRHAAVDGEAAWATFLASKFGAHIPHVQWPHLQWSGDWVRQVLRQMREGASPGSLGIPIGVWRSLPDAWMSAVARLLSMVELEGRWPAEWLDAYVAMIPKASGGSRPGDQRPITVLEVLYRLWSKGSHSPEIFSRSSGFCLVVLSAQHFRLYSTRCSDPPDQVARPLIILYYDVTFPKIWLFEVARV